MADPKEELPTRPGTSSDPSDPREIENPGDPGPPVLVPGEGYQEDPREPAKIPPLKTPPGPGV